MLIWVLIKARWKGGWIAVAYSESGRKVSAQGAGN